MVGLLIGLVLGAGAMYLVLRSPWAGHGGLTPSDAGTVAVVKVDAGTKPHGKRPHGGGTTHAPRPTGDPNLPTIDDSSPDDPAPPAPQLVVLTAGDRSLEWRGDTVVLPAQKIDVGAGGESRGLEQSEIEQTSIAHCQGSRRAIASSTARPTPTSARRSPCRCWSTVRAT